MTRLLPVLHVLLLLTSTYGRPRCKAVSPCQCRKIPDPLGGHKNGHTVNAMDCSGLKLTSIPAFQQQTRINTVLLGGNRIMRIQDNAFKNLSPKYVDLQGNRIKEISEKAFSGLEKSLKKLDLRGNQIREVPTYEIEHLKSLHHLMLDNNEIRELRNAAFPLKSLRILSLSGNEIYKLHKDSFKALNKLEFFDISHNRIHHMSQDLKVMAHLQVLNISSNTISRLPSSSLSKMKKLRELHMRNTKIESLQMRAFKTMRVLELVDISDSENLRNVKNIRALSAVNGSLKILRIANCEIRKWPGILLNSLRALETLDVSRNRIPKIPTHGVLSLSKLSTLVLSDNPLLFTPGMFKGLENRLTDIEIANLKIPILPNKELAPLLKLTRVDARANGIRNITKDFFAGIRASEFDLRNNSISEISNDAFKNSLAIKRLSLNFANNRIRGLNFVGENVCRFASVDVTNNPIACDCALFNLTLFKHLKMRGKCHSIAGMSEFNNAAINSKEFQQRGTQFCDVSKPKQCAHIVTPFTNPGTGEYRSKDKYNVVNDGGGGNAKHGGKDGTKKQTSASSDKNTSPAIRTYPLLTLILVIFTIIINFTIF